MIRTRKASSIFALGTIAALGLSACGGGSTDGSGNSSSSGGSAGGSNTAAAGGEATKGGELYYLTKRPAEHLDPQRIYIGRDISNMSRLVYRSLLTNPANESDPTKAQTPVPDIATDTGTPNDDASEWKFTIKDGVKWEDGKAVTCEDFKYGVSRAFAADVLDGGPFQYPTQMLDIPSDANGGSKYKGPYSKQGQDLFDKAVSCDGNTITYKFKQPWAEFPSAIASLHIFDPYRKDKDKGKQNNYVVFSNGPYKLDGKWDEDQGGTFVRNENYDAATDTTKSRGAFPDKIHFVQGLDNEIIAQRLIADSGDDQNAITDRAIPPSSYAQVDPVKDRATLVESPYVNYLVPNFKNMEDQKVREALMWATDKEGYANALGGDKASKPATSIVNPSLPGYKENSVFAEVPAAGDPEKAKQLLSESGCKSPCSIKVTYPGGTPTSDASFAALKEGWEKAGFKVDLDSLPDTYYDIVNKPNNDSDVFWGGWGADYPSIATVIPLLFDSRQIGSSQVGNNYGQYKNPAVDKAADAASKNADAAAGADEYMKIDETLAKDVAYIPLDITMFYYLRGSKVTGYTQTAATSMYPDLGTVGVKQ